MYELLEHARELAAARPQHMARAEGEEHRRTPHHWSDTFDNWADQNGRPLEDEDFDLSTTSHLSLWKARMENPKEQLAVLQTKNGTRTRGIGIASRK